MQNSSGAKPKTNYMPMQNQQSKSVTRSRERFNNGQQQPNHYHGSFQDLTESCRYKQNTDVMERGRKKHREYIGPPLMNEQTVEAGMKHPFCHPIFPHTPANCHTSHYNCERKNEVVHVASSNYPHPQSYKMPNYSSLPFQASTSCSGLETMKALKSSFLTKYNKLMKMKEKEIACSADDAMRETLKSHFSILDKKRNTYIAEVENILSRLEMEPNLLSSLQRQFYKNNDALKEKRLLSAYRHDILQALTTSQVLIISGEMGYGKSTLLPLYASEICSKMGIIASCHLYPATVLPLAKKLSELLRTPFGKDIGYILGKDRILSNNILLTTYKTLLKESLDSPILSQYSCIILDDYHDRYLEADIFLYKTKEILQQRPNFKLILISSHPDTGFEKFFTNGTKMSVISLPKITFPVSVCWNNLRNPNAYIERAVELIMSIRQQNKKGNILVLLPTLQETKKACVLAEEKLQGEVLCFSLHSKTTIDEVNAIFSSDRKRKIIFSTQHVESSINLPDVCFVIDSGKMKEKLYKADKQQSVTSTYFISKERAERRRQLAGHVQGGYCYRLYTETIYSTEMPEKPLPLISKLNPANLVLTLLYYKIPIDDANFICPFEKEVLRDGALVLRNFGAMKDDGLTKLGISMAIMPFELRHAKLVALGIELGFRFETIAVAALASLNMPIFSTTGKSKDIGKHSFFDPDGDYFALFHVYLRWLEQDFSEEWCKANGVNHSSLVTWHKNVEDIIAILNPKEYSRLTPTRTPRKKLIELICSCFHDNLCVYTGHFRLGYKSLKTGNTLRIHHSSTFSYKSDKPPQYIVYDYVLSHGNVDFMVNVTPVPTDIVKTMLESDKLKESSFNRRLDFTVIEPIGEILMKQAILGREGKKLKALEEEIKNNTGCDNVVIDPNVENGRIEIYTYPEHLKSAKEFLLKNLDEHLEKLRCQEEETTMPTGNVLMKMSWGKGGMITKVSGTVNKHSHQETVLNEQESVCSFVRNYSINLIWKRRLCSGIGFVTFKDPHDFKKAQISLLSEGLKVCGKDAKVCISRKASNQFYIEGLLPQTSNEDLKEAVENHLALRVENATIVCSQPFSTSEKDLEIIKETLLLQFIGYVQKGNLEVHVETPNSTDTSMKAYLNFDNITDITATLHAIERGGIKTFQGIPLNYEEVYRTTIVCAPEHYYSVQTMIKPALGVSGKIAQSTFTTSMVNNGIQLKLLANNYSIIQRKEETIIICLKGRKLGGYSVNQLRKLFSHSGQQWLKQVAKREKCYIVKNSKQKTLSVCGEIRSYDNVKSKIDEYLRNMENEIVCVINIGEKNLSRQVIKTLIVKYGITFEKFIEECNLISVEFNVQYCQLTLYGTLDSIKKAEQILESLATQNQTLPVSDENEETCPICLTVPTTGSSRRIECCGHLYCSDCLKLLVLQKSLPLKCCKEGCQREFVIEDILNILEGNEEETHKLLYHSLKVYVENNYDHVKVCPTPDCNMVYDLRSLPPSTNSNLWACPACEKVICVKCNTENHPGISCHVAKNVKKDVNYSTRFERWM